jgi:hypothetical protein
VKLSIFGGPLFFLLDERVGLSKGGLCMVLTEAIIKDYLAISSNYFIFSLTLLNIKLALI